MENTDETVLVNTDDGVLTITLNDPERMNPLSIDAKEGLLEVLSKTGGDDVRCIVLEGAGDAFCSGGDVDQMRESAGTTTDDDPVDRSHRLSNEIIKQVANIPVPVVMKIDGPAVGGGAGLATAGDIKLASDRAKIGFTFRHVGLSIDDGTSYYLPRIVGLDVAKELVFSGRLVGADEAEELGLVHDVFPTAEFDERCAEVVNDIADGPTKAMGHMKQLLNRSYQKTLEQSLEDEYLAQEIARSTSDHREGIDAFLDDRSPDFTGQ